MSDTPRTDAEEAQDLDMESWAAYQFARTLERELAEAQHRIRLLIAERDTARGFLSIRKSLCDELKSLLGTEDVAEGVARIKAMQARIATLESDLATAELEERAMKTRIAELEANQCEEEPYAWHLTESTHGLSMFHTYKPRGGTPLYRKKNHE